MILAAAQIKTYDTDTDANLELHYRMIESAAGKGAQLIVFPEMSITGYVRETAAERAFSLDDPRLSKLKALAAEKQIVIVAGAPVLLATGLYIGSIIILPDQTVLLYTKQYLHRGEELYFKSSFDYNSSIELENERIHFAICADTDEALHAQNAAQNGASIYIASICFSHEGLPSGYKRFSQYAKRHNMCVLMSNFCGQVYRYNCGGLSGFWDNSGFLVAGLSSSENALLIVEKEADKWSGYTMAD